MHVVRRALLPLLLLPSLLPAAAAAGEAAPLRRIAFGSCSHQDKPLPVFVERSILDLDAIYVNGGRRGLLVQIAPAELTRILGAVPVDAAVDAP